MSSLFGGAEREEPDPGGEQDAEQRGGQGLPGAGQAEVSAVKTQVSMTISKQVRTLDADRRGGQEQIRLRELLLIQGLQGIWNSMDYIK